MPSGFNMKNKHVPFDFDHCRIVMTTLAKFHARSIIFEEVHKKNIFEEFHHCMHEALWSRKGRGKRSFRAAVNGIIAMIDLLEIDEGERRKFKKGVMELAKDHLERLEASKEFRNTICQGDLWANNLLFKYGDGGPEACCLIDFQLAR